jgi:predicted nucleic acid-binding protein
MVIVDTTVWIDYLGGIENLETQWLEREAHRERLGLTDLILCEVLWGIREDRRFIETRSELLQLEVFATGGLDFALQCAENFRMLRKKGITIRRLTDCWIATFCIQQGHTLLHRDRDFEPFESELGLQVVRA